ncbi:MAG: hypothetical protein JWQ97_3874 [Phenylobacterium sp.]|nr:hypothetical protein [Phenylobacterium sp.]
MTSSSPDVVLRQASEEGRRPTLAAVERRLDVKHATFYRNFPQLIDWFREQVEARQTPPVSDPTAPQPKTSKEIIADLRRENSQLRRTVAIYAEALRQLTLDYEETRSQVQQTADVTDLASRRKDRT